MKKIIKEKEGYGTVQIDFMKMDISVYAKCVYTLLRCYSGEKINCGVSIKSICQDLGVSKPTVLRAIKDLEKNSLIAVKRSKIEGSNENSVNIYAAIPLTEEVDLFNDFNKKK